MDPFALDRFLIRRKVLRLFGAAFHVYRWDEDEVCFFAEQRAFKLKEDFVVYGDEAKTTPLLRIRARSILDVSATYDVADARTGEALGAVRRKGLQSLIQDTWELLDGRDEPIATCSEDSVVLGLLRRLLSNLVPQSFVLRDPQGEPLAAFHQFFNPFVFKMELDYRPDRQGRIDRRLGIGLAVCMMAIEGRQG